MRIPPHLVQTLALGALVLAAGALPAKARTVDTRSLSMGQAMLAQPQSASTAWTSPAMLAMPSSSSIALSLLPSVNLGLGLDLFSLKGLDQFLQGKDLSERDMQALMDGVPDRGIGLTTNVGTSWALSAPALGLGVFARAEVDTLGLNIPKNLLSLVLQGNAVAQDLPIDGLQGARGELLADAGVSYAFPFTWAGHAASLGATARYIQGFGFLRIAQASGSLYQFNPDGSIQGAAQVEAAVGGTGQGGALDLSFATDLSDAVRLVGKVGNLGAVNWSKVQDRVISFSIDRYAPSLAGGKPNSTPSPKQSVASGPDDGKALLEILPATLQVGAAIRPAKSLPLLLQGDVEMATGRGYGTSEQPSLHLGAEWRPLSWLPFRTGLSVGGEQPTTYSGGLGLELGASRVDLAFGTMSGMGDDARGVFYALSSQLQF